MCLKARQATADQGLRERLNKIAAQALDRAESLKQLRSSNSSSQLKVGTIYSVLGQSRCSHNFFSEPVTRDFWTAGFFL